MEKDDYSISDRFGRSLSFDISVLPVTNGSWVQQAAVTPLSQHSYFSTATVVGSVIAPVSDVVFYT